MKSFKHGACWKNVKINSGRKWSADEANEERGESGIAVECGEWPRSKIKEDHRSEGWMGEDQSNDGVWGGGRVTPEFVFLHVKLHRKTLLEKFVAANGEQISDLGKKTISSRRTKEYKDA